MKFLNWINGNKSLISAILMLIVNSDYVSGLFGNPQMYVLAQDITAAMFAGGMIHKGVKAVKKRMKVVEK